MTKIEASNVRPNSPEEAITMLIRLLTELEAREISFNCIVDEYIGVPWDELCDKGIKLFEYLKSDLNTKPDSQKQALSTSQAEKLKSYITDILKCDMQHHKGCLAPDCFTCLDSRFQMMMLDLFPDEYIKRTTKNNSDVKMYFITTFERFEEDTKTGGHIYGDVRAVGYYDDREAAINTVLNNACDIQETIYNYAVIDCVSPGLYQLPTEQLFFKWNKSKQAFEPIPPLGKNLGAFAIG